MINKRNKVHNHSVSTDPVCGMQVAADSKHQHTHDDVEYRFCSSSCHHKFTADPDKYLHPDSAVETGSDGAGKPDTSLYTCPMHPEVQQAGPGSCPKCGMALEPRTVQLEEDTTELDDMSRRFWVSTFLAIPVFISAMAAEFWPEAIAEIINPRYRQ